MFLYNFLNNMLQCLHSPLTGIFSSTHHSSKSTKICKMYLKIIHLLKVFVIQYVGELVSSTFINYSRSTFQNNFFFLSYTGILALIMKINYFWGIYIFDFLVNYKISMRTKYSLYNFLQFRKPVTWSEIVKEKNKAPVFEEHVLEIFKWHLNVLKNFWVFAVIILVRNLETLNIGQLLFLKMK